MPQQPTNCAAATCASRPGPLDARRQTLDQLRGQLARLEGSGRGRSPVRPLGIDALDRWLPAGGLVTGALHEIGARGAGTRGPATPGLATASGFAAFVLARFQARGPVVWIGPGADLYAPGLAAFSLDVRGLIVVRSPKLDDRLWALEEVLRTPGIAAGLAELDRLDLTSSRRLQLAAEAKGVSALLIRPERALDQPSVAMTRWRVEGLPSATDGARTDLGAPRFRVELLRCRGGRPGIWHLEWDKGGFHELADRIADPLPLAAGSRHRAAEA